MSNRPRLICVCGGLIGRPVPPRCPHCGANIVGTRQSWWVPLLSVLGILMMFAALVTYVWWLRRGL